MVTFEPDDARAVADFHTLFNLAVAAVSFPSSASMPRPCAACCRAGRSPTDLATPIYLDEAARETPIVALGLAAREALRLADLLLEMIQGAKQAIEKGTAAWPWRRGGATT